MQIIDLVPDLRPTILAARQMRDERNSLSRWLPHRAVQAVSYKHGRRRRVDQTVPIRGLDAPAVPIRRPGLVTIEGDLPAITPIIDLSEVDLTQEMILAQQLAGIMPDWQNLVDGAAGIGAKTVDNTLEAFRGQLLSTLKVLLESADGDVQEIDFAADPAQITTIATKWNTANGDPFADLATAQEAFITRGGAPAQVMLTTARVAMVMLDKAQKLFPNSPIGRQELNTYLASRGLPAIETYDRLVTNEAGAKSRIYPQGYATLLPSGDPIGATQMGVTQEAVQQVQNRTLAASEAPGLTVVTMGEDNPVRRAVKVAAVGMPVIEEPDQVMVLKDILA